MNALFEFLRMGGYGLYVWPAYASVIIFLVLQLFLPWQRWRQYLKQQSRLEE